jgi:hypothetical protein
MAKVVGFWLEGKIVPLERAMEKSATPGDVVADNGNYYRVFADGKYYRLALVSNEWYRAIEEFIPSGSMADVQGKGW